MPQLLNHEKFCENLKEVTSLKIMNKKKFHPEGLFSEQIFGPLQNYTCQCGIYHGPAKIGSICDICHVEIANSDERRRRFAKITLPVPVVNPLFYDLVVELGGNDLKSVLDTLMRNEKSILYMDNDEHVVTTNLESVPQNRQIWEKTNAIYKIVFDLAELLSEEIPEWKVILDNIDELLINHVIVLPPDLRPAAKGVERNNRVVDKINRYYVQLLTKREIMSGTIIDVQHDKSLFYTYFKQLQKDVLELYQHILDKLSKKEGLIRGNILGKRIDFSGRGVIVPDPTLNLDECVLPYLMFLEMYKLQIAKRLIEIQRFKLLNRAIDFVEECVETSSPVLFQLCEELAVGEVCILNRQPTLHRLGMLAFNIKLSLDHVIKVHPLICPPFNADFDGDQMAVYVPVSKEAKQEIIDKMLITKHFTNPANENLTTTPSQDIVLGIYSLTAGLIPNLLNEVEFKGQKITEAMRIFNECLPSDFRVINQVIKKRELMNILTEIKDTYNEEILMKVLDEVKKIGFKYSTIFGATLSLDDCMVSGIKEYRDNIYQTTDIRKQLTEVNNEETTNLLKENFTYAYMIESGARGSWDQVRQLILTRGFISNFEGEILSSPIKHSLLEGLTEEEFFNSTYGSRKGLLDVALNTGTSGYLSRKLIFACANLQLDNELKDCGTTDTLEINIKNKQIARLLIGRYYVEDNILKQITKENWKEFIGKVVQFRSPIFCTSPKICHTCYGDLSKTINTTYVGIVAAQALGECNTQLVLRTFHTSLRKTTKILDVNKNNYTIEDVYTMVKSGLPFYTFSCSPDGWKEVSKVIDAHKDRFEKKMLRITLDNGKYEECTLDHEWILRDGSSIKAENLKVGDSLMPIYFGQDVQGYNILISKIELIELPDYEEFYDLTVDSQYSNFALESGIFIHNSGSAVIKEYEGTQGEENLEPNNDDMRQMDIINDLSMVSKLLHKFDEKNYKVIVSKLFDVYNSNRDIYHVHFECVVAQLMWKGPRKWRLLENRMEQEPEYCSIQTVPSRESWMLGLAFSNPRKHILKGIFHSGYYTGIMDNLLLGRKL